MKKLFIFAIVIYLLLFFAFTACSRNSPNENSTANAHEKLQWRTFGARIVKFSGFNWRVKSGGRFGPGNNYFSDSKDNVWVDQSGRLHLRITRQGDKWFSAELAIEKVLGYGDYIFKTVGRIDLLDRNTVLGLFLWEYQENYAGSENSNVANEFDIEFSTWKQIGNKQAQFVCQPWQKSANIHRFYIAINPLDQTSSHAFLWTPEKMNCRSWRGHSDNPDSTLMVDTWVYRGNDLPKPESPRIHINFWCIEEPPSDLKEHEIIIAEFKFVPPGR